MPPKTQSIAVLREQQPVSAATGREKREREYAVRFEQFGTLVRWMQEFWEGATIIVPLPPMLLNDDLAYAHWAVKSGRHNEYLGQLQTMATLNLLPKPPSQPPAKVLLKATFFGRNATDATGRAERLKWPVDFLVKAGFISDDDDKHLQWAGMPTQVIVKHEPPRIEFDLKVL